ncbi:MAG: extracellular solute-binding protein family 1 [Frankiales bacterium]|jgi:multiple sugar transport system substrate-binding protein|nr:extracellular solute-binding protein family 1 [Frankiales bacterium]
MRLLPLLLGLALVAGCGSGTAGEQREDRTLTVQAAGGEGELSALRELISAYEQARPGVTVSFTGVPDQGDHIAKLGTAFAGGNPPDVFLLNYRRLGPFVDRDVLAPADLGDRSEADFYAPSLEAFTYDGELACVPQNASSTVAYLNLDLLERAGVALPTEEWTWADLEEMAKSLHSKGIAAVGYDAEIRTVAPFVWTAGGEVVDDTAEPTAMTLDTPQAGRALQYLDGLQQYGVDATARAAAGPADQFAGGSLAVFFDSRRSVPVFRKSEGLSFDVRPLPRADAGRPSVSLLASDAYCVSKGSSSLAADFASYAVGDEGGTVLARSGRTVPSVKALAQSPAFLDPAQQPASSSVFLDVIPTLRRLPNVGPEDEAEEAANDLLAQYFAGKAGLDETGAAVRTATAAAYGQRS